MEPKKPKKKGTLLTSLTKAATIPKKGVVVTQNDRLPLPMDRALAKAVTEEFPLLQDNLMRVKTAIMVDHPDFIPKYHSDGAACCDLVANIPTDQNGGRRVIIPPGNTVRIDCGCSIQLQKGYEAQVRARSSLAMRGLIVSNGIGTIDDDYRGRLTVILSNVGREVIILAHKERIGQLALKPVWYFEWEIVDKLDETQRNEGGFGSTGT